MESLAFFTQDQKIFKATALHDPIKKQDARKVCLTKDARSGLGMVITCGNTYETVLHGAFVESVYTGSPVDLDGSIKPGDQIMSVNGTNVETEYYLTVVDLIQRSSNPVELVVSKIGHISPDAGVFPVKEIIEKQCTKSKTWTVGDEKSDSMKIIVENSHIAEMPVPKPRKKNSQKKLSEPPLDVPDLTLNHSKLSDKNTTNIEQFSDGNNVKNWSIPDIIASQVKHVDSSGSIDISKCRMDTDDEKSFFTVLDKSDLLPGEIFHVVLDKKGGSLGLNIYQGSERGLNLQKHIYIHSVIRNGAAENDGRIQPGDKLMEVNGIPLEDLSYQEVVTTLRETSQVAHLVLEKGYGYSQRDEMEQAPNTPMPFLCKREFSFSKEEDRSLESRTVSENIIHSHVTDNASKEQSNTNSLSDTNSFSSLPTSSKSSVHSAKDIDSVFSLNHSNSFEHSKKQVCASVDDSIITCSGDNCKSSPSYAKDENKFQRCITSYKSTPNLAENSSDEEEGRNGGTLYRNRSTDCLLHSPFSMNPHQALVDLYHNYSYIRGSSCNIHQIPAVPIRKRKLKKLQDIYNYSNIENTFVVRVPKSSRGLGLSVTGGKDPSKDPFSQLIRIRKLYPLQPALECGKLLLGDIILEVNGNSMLGVTNQEALEILRCSPKEVELKIFRPSKSLIPSFSVFKGGIWPGFDSSSSSANSSLSRTENNSYNVETGEFEVTLSKQDGTLGFTIFKKDKSSENPAGIYVKALVREHAVSDGRIQPGDRILQVNGIDITSLSHTEALACLRNSSDKVTLKLFRDDPPLTPNGLEEDYIITKPLRWEAVELLNDRVKQKDMNDEPNTLKKKMKHKLNRSPNPASSSSSNSTSSSSSCGQEHVISENVTMNNLEEQMSSVGLHRNQRPKSLDILNFSDRKRLVGQSDDDSFRRQSSVMCTTVDSKLKTESAISGSVSSNGSGNLLRWRGSTLNGSEDSNSMDTIQENVVSSSKNLSFEKQISTENELEEEQDDYKPVPFPRTTSYNSEWINSFNVNIDRGWHSRLGFSLFDPPDCGQEKKDALPKAVKVKAVHPGSLADKDGRIKAGDCIIEVNGESMLDKSAHEVIDILRKTRGVTRMVIWRLEKH